MERKIKLAPGEFYHIYNRGVEKRPIFLDEVDKKRFVKLLYLANGTKPLVFKTIQGLPLDQIERGKLKTAIGAYVLMPNHFHILVKETQEGGITSFMEKLQTGYSMYFNKKNERVGSLFQGTFKAQHVNRDEHLKYLFAYIHLNPIKLIDHTWKENGINDIARAKSFLQKHTHSSYGDFIGTQREEHLILSRADFPEYFSKPLDFDNFLNDWLENRTIQWLPLDRI